jgi:hypothetical protein
MKKEHLFFLSIIFFASNCKKKEEKQSDLFAKGHSLGTVTNRLVEASGLVESIANPKHLWTLNDSGNPAEVFLIDQTAQIKLTCKLNHIDNRDFEDIAIGVGPEAGKNYVYAADIGDNLERYEVKRIYRFEEPMLVSREKEMLIEKFDTLQVSLPDEIRDTETLMIDPQSNDLFLVSKMEDSVRLYQVRYPFTKEVMIAELAATLPLNKIVAGNISPDGREVLMKDYERVYYWKNKNGWTLSKLLLTPPETLAYDREPQGESICWARDGSGYYTLSEKADGKLGKLLFYNRR